MDPMISQMPLHLARGRADFRMDRRTADEAVEKGTERIQRTS